MVQPKAPAALAAAFTSLCQQCWKTSVTVARMIQEVPAAMMRRHWWGCSQRCPFLCPGCSLHQPALKRVARGSVLACCLLLKVLPVKHCCSTADGAAQIECHLSTRWSIPHPHTNNHYWLWTVKNFNGRQLMCGGGFSAAIAPPAAVTAFTSPHRLVT